ncbi:MAG TPA: hypothetical protein VH280_14355 [Verrucomicrobiae bacterium]|jgi:hypothetical protein|nr:hypothetical protein [Verrucomicrobiae bacterium]
MSSGFEIPRPSEISRLLRGEPEFIAAWSGRWVASRFLLHVAVIILGAGTYGATMGWWRGPEQAMFVAIKFPLIILMVTAGNALLNGLLAPLLGLNIRFYQSFSGMVMSFTVTSAILGGFSPIMAFLVWNAPGMASAGSTYSVILLAHVAAIALAGTAGNVRLLQLLESLSTRRAVALSVLGAWLTGNLFLGSQLTWILRPFIGSPNLPIQFLRPNAFQGNFYEAVFRAIHHILIG